MNEKTPDSSSKEEKDVKMGRPKTPIHLGTRRVILTLNYKTRLFLEIIKAHGTWTSDSEAIQNLVVEYVERNKEKFDQELWNMYDREFHGKAREHARDQMQKIVKEMQGTTADNPTENED